MASTSAFRLGSEQKRQQPVEAGNVIVLTMDDHYRNGHEPGIT
jgi:hypothetical protein